MIFKVNLILVLWTYLLRCKLFMLIHWRYKAICPIKKVLYIENFPIDNSGYQYRSKKWTEIFTQLGIQCEIATLYERKVDFEKSLNVKSNSSFFIYSIKKRYKQCLYAIQFETVIVRRELLLYNDYGNLFMEKFLLKIHPNVILDFDDDIAASKNQPRKITNWYGKLLLENGNKFNNTLRLYKRFIVASNYLKEKVLQENPKLPPDNILIIPTCVDYDKYPPKKYPHNIEKITFGWIGGDHNYPLLDTLLPILNELVSKYSFKLLVIGGTEYKRDVRFEIEFVKWSMDTEVENLYRIDVGLMPLNDDLRSRGKGGFKLLQYMGLGIVSVASAITINCEIVEHGVDSFLASNSKDWLNVFTDILEKKVNFTEMGKFSRKKIIQKYTFESNKERYLSFLGINK